MSDSDPSGAPTTSAETASAPSAPPPSVTTPGPFSNNRGSGLARGKRPSTPPPQAASGAPATDYKTNRGVHPHRSDRIQESVRSPGARCNARRNGRNRNSGARADSGSYSRSDRSDDPGHRSFPRSFGPDRRIRPPAVESMPVASAVDEPKAELKILPPEEPRRVEHNWESESFRNAASQPGSEPGRPTESRSAEQRPRRDDRRGDRPYFRSERERRDDRPLESREPRSDSAPMAQNSNTGRPQSESAACPGPGTIEEIRWHVRLGEKALWRHSR